MELNGVQKHVLRGARCGEGRILNKTVQVGFKQLQLYVGHPDYLETRQSNRDHVLMFSQSIEYAYLLWENPTQ